MGETMLLTLVAADNRVLRRTEPYRVIGLIKRA
jgi:hypothetical protein